MIGDAIGLYKDNHVGKNTVLNIQDIASKIKGVSTDHAEDQKKLVCFIWDWKQTCDQEAQGKNVLNSAALSEILPLISKANEKKIANVGGAGAWDGLSGMEQKQRLTATYALISVKKLFLD